MERWRQKEINEFVANNISIINFKKWLFGEPPIFKKRVILNNSGQPIPLKEFLHKTGERRLVEPVKINRDDKELIKKHKYQYKAAMKALMGEHWRAISTKLGIYNPTTKPALVKLIEEEKKKY